jgi:replicative DNA helicase
VSQLLGQLQENLLTLLAFNDEQAKVIRGIVAPELYGGPYRHVAARIYDYIDRYKKAPGDHLADILSDKLENENQREASLYGDILTSMHEAKKGINTAYVMGQLETFIRRQTMRSMLAGLHQTLQKDTEASLEEAEQLLAKANKAQLSVFDPGTRLSDSKRALRFLNTQESAFPIGIPELDRRGFGPTRKELWLGIGNTKSGKTWMLIQLAKMALLNRLKVLHISLEMSEERSAQRYFQALFSISKRKETLNATKFTRDSLGRYSGFDDVRLSPKLSFDDPAIAAKLEKLIGKWSLRILDHIIIKQFPTGALTVNQLVAYMDNLEATQQFVPDLLIIDYPDLFKLDKDNFRLGIDAIYKDIRGLAVARNCAVAVVSQSHRTAAKAKQVGADNVAEAYSKISHADTIITYSQTESERALGLARLHVAGGRNDSDKCTIIISQQYGMGAFVIDSILLSGNYWNNLPQGDENV